MKLLLLWIMQACPVMKKQELVIYSDVSNQQGNPNVPRKFIWDIQVKTSPHKRSFISHSVISASLSRMFSPGKEIYCCCHCPAQQVISLKHNSCQGLRQPLPKAQPFTHIQEAKKVQREHVNKILSKLLEMHKIKTGKRNCLQVDPFKWNVSPCYAGHWFIKNGGGGKKLNISGGIYQEKLSCPEAFINLICRVSTSIKGPTKVVFFKADVKRSMHIVLWITLWEDDSPFYHMEWKMNYFVFLF